jgi:glycosyltransferase involved in cell wall biosynthesis
MTKKNPKISVVLATFNEEKNLARCLDSVAGLADEIVVVDGSSADNTVNIAKKYNAKVITTDNKPNFHINKNMAIAAAKGEWILQLDADEVVSPELAAEIKDVVTSGVCNGYWVNRKNWFLARFLTKGGQYPDPTLRLYKQGFGHLPAQDVHEQAEVVGPAGYLKNDLLHYRDTDFAKYLAGFNRYTGFIATQLQAQKVSLGIFSMLNYLFVKPGVTFFMIYFRHRGYVDGFPGFVFALFSGLRFGVAYIKYWQNTRYPA